MPNLGEPGCQETLGAARASIEVVVYECHVYYTFILAVCSSEVESARVVSTSTKAVCQAVNTSHKSPNISGLF